MARRHEKIRFLAKCALFLINCNYDIMHVHVVRTSPIIYELDIEEVQNYIPS